MPPVIRRWGDDRALRDEGEARDLLLDAAGRCILRRGNTQIRMSEVADEAAVARSTVYRYFTTRDELLLALVLARIDRGLTRQVDSLRQPDDAAQSITALVLGPVETVAGNPLNEALFSSRSTALTTVLEIGSEQIVDLLAAHYDSLFRRWQDDGQVHSDLDLRETVRWLHTATLFLLAPAWRHRPATAKRRFIEQYVVRALVS